MGMFDGLKAGLYTFRIRVLGNDEELAEAQQVIEESLNGQVENAGGSLRVTLTRNGWDSECTRTFTELYQAGKIASYQRHYV